MPILTDEERLGTTLAGKYVLDALIGRGGMGTVFSGHHVISGRPVAVKILHPQHVRDPIAVRRFLNEARTASSFRHPNVVDVLDVDVLDDSTVYIVLELLEGETLGELLNREHRLSIERTLTILLPVLRALSHAHRLGIIHRDLKPDNIFLTPGTLGVFPVLLDFGIAKMLDAPEQSVETVTGAIIGTPQYMAPEQALGSAESSPRLDVYAMGVVVFECLAGQRPIDGPNPATVLARLVTGQVPTLSAVAPEIPENISAVVMKALALEPSERFDGCDAFASALFREAEALGVMITLPDPGGRLSTPSDGARTQKLRAVTAADASIRRAALKVNTPTPVESAPTMTEAELRDSRPAAADNANRPAAGRPPHSTFAPTTSSRHAKANRASLVGAIVAFVAVGAAGYFTLRRTEPATNPEQASARAAEIPRQTMAAASATTAQPPVQAAVQAPVRAAATAPAQPAATAPAQAAPSVSARTADAGASRRAARSNANAAPQAPTTGSSAGSTAGSNATSTAPTRAQSPSSNHARPPEVAREW